MASQTKKQEAEPLINHYDYNKGAFIWLKVAESIKKAHYELMAEYKTYGGWWLITPLTQGFDRQDLLTQEAMQMLSNFKYKKVKTKGKTIWYECENWYVPE